MKLKIGDIIESKYNPEITRKITEVRKTGYTWMYEDQESLAEAYKGLDYWSENSTDPFFDWGMEIKRIKEINYVWKNNYSKM